MSESGSKRMVQITSYTIWYNIYNAYVCVFEYKITKDLVFVRVTIGSAFFPENEKDRGPNEKDSKP